MSQTNVPYNAEADLDQERSNDGSPDQLQSMVQMSTDEVDPSSERNVKSQPFTGTPQEVPDYQESQTPYQGSDSTATMFQGARSFNINGHPRFINNVTVNQQSDPGGFQGFENFGPFVSFEAFHDSSVQDCDRYVDQVIREKALKQSQDWIDNPDATEQVIWLRGPVSIGKTAITLEISRQESVVATFFFSRSDASRNDGNRLFTTLAWQLASSISHIKKHIVHFINKHPDLPKKRIEDQFEYLIVRPFAALKKDTSAVPPSNHIVVIDGIDECIDIRLQRRFLKVIEKAILERTIPLRFIISSRPELHIKDVFDQLQCPVLCIDLAKFDLAEEIRKKEKELKEEEYRLREEKRRLVERAEEIRKKAEELRKWEETVMLREDAVNVRELEAGRKEREALQREMEAKQLERETRSKELAIKCLEEEARRMEAEMCRREEDVDKKLKEIERKEEAGRREEDINKREEKVLHLVEEVKRREEELRKREQGLVEHWRTTFATPAGLTGFSPPTIEPIRDTVIRGPEQKSTKPFIDKAKESSHIVLRKKEIKGKLVIVGDGHCGKIPVPTVFETFKEDVEVDGEHVELELLDTGGLELYDKIRPLSYPCSDVILICFGADSPDSLDKVQGRWISEITYFCPGLPILLVGCKKDLRDDPRVVEELRKYGQTPVTPEEGMEVAQKIGAKHYLECSAKTGEGVREVFQYAAREVLLDI